MSIATDAEYVDPSSILNIEEADRIKLTVRDLNVALASSQGKTRNFFSFSSNKNESNIDIEKNQPKKVINGVDIDVNPGEILAILGGSGSGKTTLLNTLSHRVTSNDAFHFEGLVKYNEHTNINNIRNSYLLQDDSFLPHLTVLETLNFAADLKLPSNTTKLEKKILINSILKQLGLERIASSIICTAPNAVNLSGGERRLVSLALQLLNKPSLLYLDEITTGLDANSSIRLVSVLHNLAKNFGITMVMTIHQPRYEILEKIDKISILSKGGNLIYFGSVEHSIDYFASQGYTIKDNVNLADFLIDLSMKDLNSPDLEFESSKRIQKLIDNWKLMKHKVLNEIPYENTFAQHERKNVISNRISLFKEVNVLTRRTLLISVRDTFSLLMLDGAIIVIAIILGWLFYKPQHDLSGIRSIQSQLYVMLETVGFVPLFYEISRLWMTDGKFFFREKNEGIVTITGWLISRRIAKFPIEDFPISLVFCLISYFMWGLRHGASYFLIYFAVGLLINITGLCCAMLCFSLGRDFATSSLISNVFYQLQNNGCGFFVNAKTMPVYVRWIKYVAYFWYGFGSLASNQFTHWTGDCHETDCSEYTGEYILETLGYNENWINLPICVLLCWAIGFYVAAGIVLHYKSTDVTMSKPKNNNFLTNSTKDTTVPERTSDQHKNLLVDITLKDIELWVSPKKFNFGLITIIYEWFYKRYFEKHDVKFVEPTTGKKLLNSINAEFEAGKVNAILGPSGSGKSTLLNYLAGRLSKSSTFTANGSIFLNQTRIPKGRSLGKLCSYVMQHDNHLIPTLTVRETLYFQGKIRLPGHIKNNALLLNSTIDELILKMGLKDCENILIGDDFHKGISGGEKKRVSIAIQLLDDSKILLLDEPSSGLDSFTATQILKILNKLAEEDNKTIILTIHQPKLELFEQFKKILLLSRGGNVIYNHTTEDLKSYFENLGFPCPKLTNIADHLLDLVSHNLHEDKTTAQDRIDLLVSNFTKTYQAPNATENDDYPSLSKLIVTKYKKNFRESFAILAKRQILTMIRDPNVIFCRLIQIVAVAGLQLLFFAPLTSSYDGISNRLGVIQETMNLYYVGFINNIAVYPNEVSYFTSEYADGVVDIEAFFMAYLTNELPFEIIGSISFALLVAIATNLARTPGMFFTMFFVSLVSVNAGESIGIMIVTIFSSLEIAINVLANLLIIGIFMAGTMSLQLPPFFKAWNYLSPLKYGVGVIAKLAFENKTFSCESGESCVLDNGEAILEYYGMDCNFSVYMGALAVILVVYRIISYLLLCIKIRMS